MAKINGENIYIKLSTEAFPTFVPVGSICFNVSLVSGTVSKHITTDNGANWIEVKEASDYSYIATGGSDTTIVDSTKDFETDILKDTIAEVTIGNKTYFRTISANTADTITIATLPGASASAILGDHSAGEVTIVCAAKGIAGNGYTVNVVLSSGNNMTLSASFADSVLTVYLGTDAEGLADGSKNTATAIAAKIDELQEFTATMTGSGGVIAVTEQPVAFAGGIAVVEVAAGCKYRIMPPIATKALT